MDDSKPIIEPVSKPSNWFDARFKICLYSAIWGCALEMVNITETQYIYHYLKVHSTTNSTISKDYANTTATRNSCGENLTSADDHIQGLASDWTWYMQLVIYSLGLLVMSVVGPMSDRIGRKPVLIGTVTLFVVTFALRTYAIYAELSLYLYLLFCAVEGLAGCHYTFDVACLAILSTNSKDEKSKSFNLALFDTMMVVGVCVSDIVTGYLIKLFGFTYPFLAGASILLFLVILIAYTLDEVDRKPTKYTSLKINSILRGIFSLCSKYGFEGKRKYFIMYLMIYFINEFPVTANTTIRTLYELGWPFCWSSVKIGWYTAAAYFWEFMVGILILKALLCFTNEVKIIFLGYTSAIACFVFFGLSTSDWMIYSATAIGVVRILPIPLVKAIMSRMVPPDKQGALFANIYLFEAICRLGGSTLFNNIYHHTRPIYKGLVFFIMAGFPLVAAFLMTYMSFKQSTENRRVIIVNEPDKQDKVSCSKPAGV